ncbi:MAG: UDP-N-acetylmuramoyl-L-alanine--D-glutamate ligase, partial [Lachnospiraceae bacterium]|nr:UDP-N-acetylmuramoyl-L-alanine--D-glutamate ligase [Lachnospiraceae bacterium]
MIEVKDKRVIVVGTGKSGIGSAVLLEKNGAVPVIYDGNEQTDTGAVRAQLCEKLGCDTRAKIYTGAFPREITAGIELAVLSPGVPVDAEFV